MTSVTAIKKELRKNVPVDGFNLLNPVMMRRFRTRPIDFFTNAKNRHDTPFYVFVPGVEPLLFFDHPEAVRKLMTSDPDVFCAGAATKRVLGILVGESSLLSLDGKRHLRERKLLLPPFHGDRMKAYGEVMTSAASRHVGQWRRGETEMSPVMASITMDVILRAVFGVSGDKYELLKERITKLLHLAAHPTLFIPFLRRPLGRYSPMGRFLAAKRQADDMLFEEIDRRRRNTDFGEDLCSLMIQATYDDGTSMNNADIRDELMTMLVAGHETSATALSWCLDRLSVEQRVQARIRDEIKGMDPSNVKRETTPFLDATVKEVLRLNPVIPAIGRMVQDNVEFCGYQIPKGTVISASAILAHRREQAWPEPLRFKPERFLDVKPNPYTYFPFGGGSRRCIGMAFALYEIRIVLATLLQQFEFTKDGTEPSTTTRKHITLAPLGRARINYQRLG